MLMMTEKAGPHLLAKAASCQAIHSLRLLQLLRLQGMTYRITQFKCCIFSAADENGS
jgi:hypothetical protein